VKTVTAEDAGKISRFPGSAEIVFMHNREKGKNKISTRCFMDTSDRDAFFILFIFVS